jgi:hypothetical protein
VGEGEGRYPTVTPFRYGEEIHVWHTGKPFLAYAQRTWDLDDGRPLHAETGYWRLAGNGKVELVLAHPTGVAEVSEGEAAGTSVSLSSRSLGLTSTAKQVTEPVRRFEVKGTRLTETLEMAAMGHPLQPHLHAVLEQVARAKP